MTKITAVFMEGIFDKLSVGLVDGKPPVTITSLQGVPWEYRWLSHPADDTRELLWTVVRDKTTGIIMKIYDIKHDKEFVLGGECV